MSPKTKEKNSAGLGAVVDSFLSGKDYKNHHYSFEDHVEYKVSTGSLLFDMATDGGIGPGIVRFIGQYAGGKTSESLELLRNFQNTVSNPFIVYFNAEGRVNSEVLANAGLKFEDSDNFKVVSTQTLHVVYDTMTKIIRENQQLPKDQKKQCAFVIDSLDSLSSADDQMKTAQEATKVAGGAVVASQFLKKVGLALNTQGHLCIMISQRRDTVSADRYKATPFKNHNASGGHALDHHANWIFEFSGRFKSDRIAANTSAALDDDKNPAVGHYCKLRIKKCPNEKEDLLVRYPVKYNEKGGSSIWVSKEIVETMEKIGWFDMKGAWIYLAEEIIQECKEINLEVPEKFQGKKDLYNFVENNEGFYNYAYKRISNAFSNV